MDKNIVKASENIFQKKKDILTVTNGSMIQLFWNIGKLLERHAKESANNNFTRLEQLLLDNYGEWLSIAGFSNILKFAKKFPDFGKIRTIIHRLTWNHICGVILLARNNSEGIDYLQRAAEDGLKVEDLKLLIRSKKSSSNINKKIPGFPHHNTIPNIFKENPALIHSILLPKKKLGTRSLDMNSLVISIDKLLQDFRNFENKWVNENTLMAFWEVGNILIQRRFNPGSSVSASKLLTDVAAFCPNSFMMEEFNVMYQFAKLIPDKYLAVRISQLIGWYHLKEILHLEDRRAVFYYAKLTASDGLGVRRLKARIQNSSFEKSEESKMSEWQFMKKMISVSEETQEYKKGNSIFTNKRIWLDFGDNLDSTLPVKSIFKSPYLKFLQESCLPS